MSAFEGLNVIQVPHRSVVSASEEVPVRLQERHVAASDSPIYVSLGTYSVDEMHNLHTQ